jgi:hypothetical protein
MRWQQFFDIFFLFQFWLPANEHLIIFPEIVLWRVQKPPRNPVGT